MVDLLGEREKKNQGVRVKSRTYGATKNNNSPIRLAAASASFNTRPSQNPEFSRNFPGCPPALPVTVLPLMGSVIVALPQMRNHREHDHVSEEGSQHPDEDGRRGQGREAQEGAGGRGRQERRSEVRQAQRAGRGGARAARRRPGHELQGADRDDGSQGLLEVAGW